MAVRNLEPAEKTIQLNDSVNDIYKVQSVDTNTGYVLSICFRGQLAENVLKGGYGNYQVDARIDKVNWNSKVVQRARIKEECRDIDDSTEEIVNPNKPSIDKPHYITCGSERIHIQKRMRLGCFIDPTRGNRKAEVYVERPDPGKIVRATSRPIYAKPLAWTIDIITSPFQLAYLALYLALWTFAGSGVPGVP